MAFFFLQLGSPTPPIDLNVCTVTESAANITWNPPTNYKPCSIDFYKVVAYTSESGMLLASSHVKDTYQFSLQNTTSEVTVNITTVNKCGQSSEMNASKSFRLEGKFLCRYHSIF